MFDSELASVIAIFAGIAALIAYIRARTKRNFKVNTQELKLKKLSTVVTTKHTGLDLEEWNFPKPPTPVSQSPMPTVMPPHTVVSAHEPTSAFANLAFTGASYQELAAPKSYANERTFNKSVYKKNGLRTRLELRESVITMTILGPCRALAPFQD